MLAFEADMEKAFAAQFSQDKVGVSGLCARSHGDGCPDRCCCCCSGVLHLHGGGGSEGEPVGAKVRHSLLLLSRLLSHLHPAVAWNQNLLQQDHQVRVKSTWNQSPGPDTDDASLRSLDKWTGGRPKKSWV